MNYVRETLAFCIFMTGVILCITLFTGVFRWMDLFFALACFTLAYFIWPSKKNGQRHDDSIFLDILEIFIEFPVRIIFWLFRVLRAVSHKNDVDLDI